MKIWTVSNLIKEKPAIIQGTGLSKAKVVTVITTFFRLAMIEILKGSTVKLPFGSSIGIYRSEQVNKKPPLKRSRFKKKIEYAVSKRGMNVHYSIIADAGPKFNKTTNHKNRLIKIEATQVFRSTLSRILNKTNHEYKISPWQ